MDREQIVSSALDIGEQMLISGAEVGRVEAAIRFICTAYGCSRTDVFTITSSIVVTITDQEGRQATQTRRITGVNTDLTRLHRLNGLAREICATKPTYGQIQDSLEEILSCKRYPLWLEAVGSLLIAGAFAVFFGGSWADGLVAAVLGFVMRYGLWLLKKVELNQILINVVATFFLSLSAILLVRHGMGHDANEIIIGNIMLLIPGIAMTNSLRDMISGDIMTGMLRLFDAVLVAAAIAAGYILAASLLGGGL